MKRFLLKSLLYSIPIITPIVLFTIFINPHLHGDIGPLGYITFADEYAVTKTVNNKVHNCGYNYAMFNAGDILTIGDSFSQTNEREISYNYFLAEYWNNNVFNLYQDRWANPFNRFIYLSKTNNLPNIVIVESVERYLIERLNDVNLCLTPQEMIQQKLIDTTINNESIKRKSILEKTQEWIKRNLRLKGYENPIHHVKLSKSLFSCDDKEYDLYFYCDDIKNLNLRESLLDSAIVKLDSLFNYAASINIDLYILVAADKYDVYQDFIIDNEYQNQYLLDNIKKRYNHTHLIISKDTLYHMVENGVKDVYWSNNTHWSPIGSEAVARQVLQHIEQ